MTCMINSCNGKLMLRYYVNMNFLTWSWPPCLYTIKHDMTTGIPVFTITCMDRHVPPAAVLWLLCGRCGKWALCWTIYPKQFLLHLLYNMYYHYVYNNVKFIVHCMYTLQFKLVCKPEIKKRSCLISIITI